MKRLRITTKITALVGLCGTCALIVTGVLLMCMQTSVEREQHVFTGFVRQIDLARQTQVDLKKQVQEWKNILLRGGDRKDFDQYQAEFFNQEQRVQEHAHSLVNILTEPATQAMAVKFLDAHADLGRRYREALDAFVGSNRSNATVADRMVRGADRGPADSIDEIVASIDKEIVTYEASRAAAVVREQGYTALAAATAFLMLIALGMWMARRITKPIGTLVHAVSRVSAEHDYGLRIDGDSRDEVGLLAKGVNQMLATIQERTTALQASRDTFEKRVEQRTFELQCEISKHQQAAEALRESEERFRTMMRTMNDAVVLADQRGIIISWNEGASAIFGYTEEEVLGQPFSMLMPQQYREAYSQGLKRFGATGQPHVIDSVVELQGLRKNGSEFPLELSLSSWSARGEIFYGGIMRDITDRKKAEQKFRDVVESAPDAMIITDPAGNIVLINAQTERLFGHTREELLGRNIEVLMPERFRRWHPRHRERYLSDPSVRSLGTGLELYCLHKDGREFAVEFSVSPIHTEDGVLISSSIRDVTERKRIEEEVSRLNAELEQRVQERTVQLRRSERELADFFDNATEGLHWVGGDGRILWVNQAELDMLGYRRDEYEGHQIGEFHADHAVIGDILRRLCGGESLYNYEARLRCKDGEIRYVLINSNTLVEDGKLIHTRCFTRDITDRKRAEDQLRRLNDELEQRVAERTRQLEDVHKQLLDASRRAGMAEVATNVLHNVGNVLNSVNVSAGVAAESVRNSKAAGLAKVVALLQERERDLATFITSDARGKHLPTYLADLSEHLAAEQRATSKELESLQGFIEHIKEIVTMQQSYAKASGVKQIINVVDLVEDSLRMNEGALIRHGVKVVRDFSHAPPINIDKHQVLQILINLVRNAKYACSESGRSDKVLTIRVARVNDGIHISVIDNGLGIAPENLTRIFSYGFTTKKDGHGFGLHGGALAAQQLGGRLTVHSEGESRGATFTLELPLEIPQVEPA